MHVERNKIEKINALRREQGLMKQLNSWDTVFKFADPALHGLLNLVQQKGFQEPEVGYELRSEQGELTTLDVAWPNFYLGSGLGVSLGEKESLAGWEVLDLKEALERFS